MTGKDSEAEVEAEQGQGSRLATVGVLAGAHPGGREFGGAIGRLTPQRGWGTGINGSRANLRGRAPDSRVAEGY